MEGNSPELSALLEEFLQAVREGKNPRVEEYAARFPGLASQIRELFPTALLVEEAAGSRPRPSKAAAAERGDSSLGPENPYLSRVMIEHPSRFYGRRRELARILSRLGSSRPQSVSIVGERRIGKSSLLNALTWRATQEKFLLDPGALTFVYIDFQQFPRIELVDFFDLLIGRIGDAVPHLEIAKTDNRYRRYQSVLDALRENGTGLILLFDEFDSVTSNPAFGPDFYSFLRSCANNYPMAYVTSSKMDLQQLCHSTAISDSPFFNIFSNLYLRGFTREEALNLIASPSERSGVPLADFSESILELGGCFPFYLQIACSVYFEWAAETRGTSPPTSELQEQFLEEAATHFSYFWEHCSSEKKETLRRLAAGRQPGPSQQFSCKQLLRSGYLEKEDDTYRLFSATFAGQIPLMDSLPGSHPDVSTDLTATAGADWQVESTVHQYRILSMVAKGGMGVVYRAEDETLRREVAIKVIRSELVSDRTARKRALQEARTAAALKHPSIASVYELFEHHQMPAMVMEWVPGRTLSQILKEEGPLEWRNLFSLLRQACSALAYAHKEGVVHRDLKPSNLMVTDEEQLKITDFGLAKYRGNDKATAQDLTQSGVIVGTVNYMSPEQARGDAVDYRSDLFSMGIVLFECLTGKLPFQRRGLAATLRAITQEPAPYLGLYQIENADKLDRVVGRLLKKSPGDRYQSADELLGALDRMLQGKKGWISWLRSRLEESRS